MNRLDFIEKIIQYYDGNKDILSKNDINRKAQIDYIINMKLEDIVVSDKKIIDTIVFKFGEKNKSKILENISIAERILANGKTKIKNYDSEKYWIRYMISESCKEAIRIAREKNDAYSIIQASNIMGKHFSTDKDEETQALYDKIVPFIPIITADISVLGINPIPNVEQLKQKLMRKFEKEFAEDIDYEEVRNEENISE